MPLNPDLTVYKRKVIKRAKLILKISPISHISFLLCASKYIKLNIQQIHFRISSHKSEQSIYFVNNKNRKQLIYESKSKRLKLRFLMLSKQNFSQLLSQKTIRCIDYYRKAHSPSLLSFQYLIKEKAAKSITSTLLVKVPT